MAMAMPKKMDNVVFDKHVRNQKDVEQHRKAKKNKKKTGRGFLHKVLPKQLSSYKEYGSGN
jgi:hypothetical protein